MITDALIHKISIQRFRSFLELECGPFGNVNLITGKNNAGKSSLLEAIHLIATDGSPGTIERILTYREENLSSQAGSGIAPSPDDTAPICSLFTGFPRLADCNNPIVISTTGHNPASSRELKMGIGWYTEQFDDEQGRRYIKAEPDMFGEVASFPMIEIYGTKRSRRLRLDNQRTFKRPFIESESHAIPCVYLDAFSSRSTNQLSTMWDSVALTEAENEVLTALQIISPEITGINMIGNDSSRVRRAIVKSKQYPTPIPLRSFGDGINRIFSIILALANAKGGILLIDEIENGLHHSILVKAWETIFKTASRLNVQIFATSHSWDCIESFQKAANNHPSEGALIRLTSLNGKTFQSPFSEQELEIATNNKIELR